MSLLTPLYVLGLLAVSLPVVFHLIRRMPRGRLSFSSLMFLGPSPPRLTRRSRLDNLLLLLLRALVLILLALAFTRPFWREAISSEVNKAKARRVAILLDTSASMRRGDLWQQAVAKVDEVLDSLRPEDDVALFAFNRDVEALVGFDDPAAVEPAQRTARVRAALKGLAPGWAASELGQALIIVAEELNRAADSAPGNAPRVTPGDTPGAGWAAIREIALVSDLQQGCRTDALQAYEWPRDVQLAILPVAPANPTNAGLHLLADRSGEFEEEGDQQTRVRVTNDRDSRVEQFELQWGLPPASGESARADGEDVKGEEGPGPAEGKNVKANGGGLIDDLQPASPPSALPPAISIHVPPGESRTVRVPLPPEGARADRLVLTGDDQPFDNVFYVAGQEQEEVSLLYIGSDEGHDAQGLLHYLRMAFPETARRKTNLIARKPQEPLAREDLSAARLVVVTEAVPDQQAEQLKQSIDGGGTVLYVLQDVDAASALGRLMGSRDLALEEAPTEDYAMLAEVDFGHPLFAPFADPRFNDFTKIHFWRHRRLRVGDVADVRVVARFDDGDPALLEQARGEGRLLVLSSGWHPADSQLARSTKFIPLLYGVLERAGIAEAAVPQYQVGDEVPIPEIGSGPGSGEVRRPDGESLKLAGDARVFTETDLPGVYHLALGEVQQDFAVNVPASESRTAPLEAEQLEALGVRLADRPESPEQVQRRRQLRDMELEGKQKLWRWLMVAALGVLIGETWLAGRLARRTKEAS